MSTSIKDLPDEERPREKLLTLGAKALSNVELLAILYILVHEKNLYLNYLKKF